MGTDVGQESVDELLNRRKIREAGGEKASGDASGEADERPPWQDTKLLRGLQLFLLLTVVGVLIVVFWGRVDGTAIHWRSFPVALLALLTLQSLFDLLAGGLRTWILLRAFETPIPFGRTCAANAANILLGALTPSQTGGGLGQIFVLVRSGAPLTIAAVASWVSFLGTILVLLGAALALQLYQGLDRVGMGWEAFSRATVMIFVSVLALFLLALPNPKRYRGRIQGTLGRLPFLSSAKLQGRIRSLEQGLENFGVSLRRALKNHPAQVLLGLLISPAIYLNKFLIAYVILQGMALAVPLSEVLHLQSLQYLVTYFAPTPGASGLAEITAAEIMRGVLPAGTFLFYLLLWRTFSLYLPMLFGAFLLFAPSRKKRF